ncbi:MAG: phage baseplate assembly protein V [Myxococcota bacterium]|nr:phage baseplate assembly protein V [Myxococcota bacterium]
MSTTIAIVIDNVDPSKMHRIKVKFTTDTLGGRNSHSSWCRMLTPMAGMNRGLTMLPEVGTEVLVGFAYRSATPYILGAVYNGVDLPEPYRNDDCLNNVRVFWSRNDHMVVFDDTEGFESVGFGAQAPDRLDVTSAGLHGVLSSSERVLTHCSDGDTIVEAGQTVSVRCANFRLEADATIDIEAGNATTAAAGSRAVIDGGSEATFTAAAVKLNPSSPAAVPARSKPVPPHNHPPIFGAGLGLNALSGLPEGGQGAEGEAVAPGDPTGRETPATGDGDAWDSLRDKTKATVGSRVDETVSDLLGGRMGDVLGDAAADLAEKGVDAAFDAVESAIRGGFTRSGMGASGDSTRDTGDSTRDTDDSRGTGSATTTPDESSGVRGPAGESPKPAKAPVDVDPGLPGGLGSTADADSSSATLEAERAPTDAPDPGLPSSVPSTTDAAGSGESAPTLGSPEPALGTGEASADESPVAGALSDTDDPESPTGADVGSGTAGASGAESGSTDSVGEPGADGGPPTAAVPSEAETADSPDPAAADPELRRADGAVRVEPGMDDSVAAPSARPTGPDRPGVDAKPERNPDGDRGVRGEPTGPRPGSDDEAGTRESRGPRTPGGPSIDIGDIIDDLTPDDT